MTLALISEKKTTQIQYGKQGMNITKKLIVQSVLAGLLVALLVLIYEYVVGPISANFLVRGIGIGILCGFASVTFLLLGSRKRS
ncbi:hypothetical protein IFT74_06275 [Oxalobacteraceae sp. CFBP 8755]|nr:hypothetical protein [Oxalobacteraceae sp. CFBP 8755]